MYLYETAVPQPGVDLEDSLTREAVEGTLNQDTACRPQETILEEKMTAEHSGEFFQVNWKHEHLMSYVFLSPLAFSFLLILTSLSDLRLSEAATAGVVRPTLPFVIT